MTQWAVAHQAPLSMEFSRQEYRSGLPCPSPGDLPDPGIKPGSPAWQADSLSSEPSGKGVQNKCYEVKKKQKQNTCLIRTDNMGMWQILGKWYVKVEDGYNTTLKFSERFPGH